MNNLYNKNIKPEIYMIVMAVFFAFITVVKINAQMIQLINGTETTASFIDSVKKYITEEKNYVPDSLDIKIGIVVHKIRSQQGTLNLSDEIIRDAVNVANGFFSSSGIHFYIYNFEILDNYNYGFVTEQSVIDEVTMLYSKGNIINLYLVNFAMDSSYYGFTYYPDQPDKNDIFLLSQFIQGNYLTTLLGNFFGLLPTHERMGGLEFVDGSNCDSAGDFICDTYADPNLSYMVNPFSCNYEGFILDDNGQYYVPSVANIMSESRDECKCILTDLQKKRIQFYYSKFRNYLK